MTPKQMTAKEALTEAWSIIQHMNCGYHDKICLFYHITPYPNRNFGLGDGYISWKLGVRYSARHQFYNPIAQGSCWHGSPPDENFLENIRSDGFELRGKIANAIHEARKQNAYGIELDSYRASDEVDPMDEVFFNK